MTVAGKLLVAAVDTNLISQLMGRNSTFELVMTQWTAPFAAIVLCAITSHVVQAQPVHGQWEARAEAIWLRREISSSLVLAELQGGPVAALTSSSLDFEYEPGVRVELERQLDSTAGIEASYFGLHDWSASAALTNPGGAQLFSFGLVSLANSFPGTRIAIDQSTKLHNAEINLIRYGHERTRSAFVGVRYLNVQDELLLLGEDTANFFTERTTIDAKNHLVGAQLGGRWGHQHNRTSVEAFAKGGLYLNTSQQDLRDVVLPATQEASLSGQQIIMSTVIEAGLEARYQMTDCLSLTAGYQILHIGGVALAPDQIALLGDAAGTGIGPTNAEAGVNTGSTILFHGFFAGFGGSF